MGSMWMSPTQAAKRAGVCRRTLQTWMTEGLRNAKVGQVVRIKSEWLDAFIESNERIDADTENVRRRLGMAG